MRHLSRVVFLPVIIVSTIILTACPKQESIGRINADPARYSRKEVAIAGRVTDSYGVLGRGAYKVDDGTGSIWVVTDRGLPSRGARVGAKGYVQTGFSLVGRSFGTILQESGRRSSSR